MSVLFLVLFLGTMFSSLFHMSHDMGMNHGMSSCPFMAHEEVICPMSLIDHVGAWKSAFTEVTTTFVLLLSFTSALILLSTAPNLLRKIRLKSEVIHRDIRERIYSFSYRPLQEMYSSGILNPKLF